MDGFFEIICSVYASDLEVGTTSHGLDGVVGTAGHRRGSPSHSFVEMHHTALHKVNIFVGGLFEIMCSVSASVLEVGTTSHGLDGVVGTVGHRRGSPSYSFVEMHRIT